MIGLAFLAGTLLGMLVTYFAYKLVKPKAPSLPDLHDEIEAFRKVAAASSDDQLWTLYTKFLTKVKAK
jgi:hypothetical protein